jgi:plasmid stabilization system protein ParE
MFNFPANKMKIKWNVRARYKSQQIVNYIAADNPSAAIKYGNEIFSKTEKLLEFPNADLVYQVNGQHIIRKIIIGKTKRPPPAKGNGEGASSIESI